MDPYQQNSNFRQTQEFSPDENSQYHLQYSQQHPMFRPPPIHFPNPRPFSGDNSQYFNSHNPQHPFFSSPPNPNRYRPNIGGSSVNVSETQFAHTPGSDEPDFSTQPNLDNIVLEEEESVPGRKRTKWCDEEDILLIGTYLNVSKDPIVGTDQSGKTFWERIEEQYNEFRTRGLVLRKFQQLKSRWNTVNGCVQAFVGCYNEATRHKRSGCSEKDIMQEAHLLYVHSNPKGENFRLEHAWRFLKEEPKWMGHSISTSSRQKHSIERAFSSSSNPSTPIDCSEYEHPQPSTRPMGQKAAKRKDKTKG